VLAPVHSTLSQDLKMKKLIPLFVSFALFGSANAVLAQAKTRAQVYQELIDAKNNGLDYVTDNSYPEVATVNEAQVAWLKRQNAEKAASEQTKAQANAAN
jgi:hypothetical protein